MNTTQTDPWALLREARDSVDLDAEAAGNSRFASEDERVSGLLSRIDAALAERQDSETDIVEWQKGGSEDDYAYAQPSSDTYVTVSWLDGQWRWSARRVQGCSGYCATEAEAKSAAIAAAKGMM